MGIWRDGGWGVCRVRTLRGCGLAVSVGVLLLAVDSGVSRAAVAHEYLSGLSSAISVGAGVPAPSHVNEFESMTVDGGHLWIGEHIEGGSGHRVDEFVASTGEFVRQLPEVEARGIAVGHSTGSGVVYAGGGSVVSVFSEAGGLLGSWNGSDTPAGAFGFVSDVAADDTTGLVASGDVYVVDQGSDVVDIFMPEAGGKEKYVGQLTGICPVEGGSCEAGEVIPFENVARVTVNESSGDVLVAERGSLHGAVDVFAPVSAGVYSFQKRLLGPRLGEEFGQVSDLAVDGGSGEIYVSEQAENRSGSSAVDEFNVSGEPVGRLTGANTPGQDFRSPKTVSVDSVTHDVYVGDDRAGGSPVQPPVVDVFGEGFVVPDAVTLAASEVTGSGARLNGTVNPDGVPGAVSCMFAWGLTVSLGESSVCSPPPVGEGSSPVAVQTGLSGLSPDTRYFYRLEASNQNGTNPGEAGDAECEGVVSLDGCFVTSGPGFHGLSVSDVAADSATFHATINPHGAPSTYFFEYGTSAGYGFVSVSGEVGSGEGDVEVPAVHVQGLAAGATYHYRVVVKSEVAPGVFEVFDGADQTFHTQSVVGGAVLPSGDEWEQVSPAAKHGALIETLGQGRVTQAARGGGAISYLTDAPTESEPQGYANLVQVLSTRGAAGWGAGDIASAHTQATTLEEGDQEYREFSEDLRFGALQPVGSFTASLSGEASEQTAYLRTNYVDEGNQVPCSVECFRPFVTGKPGIANVAAGTEFGEEGKCPPQAECGPQFVDANETMGAAVLRSPVALIAGANPGALYEWSGGQLAPVSILPGGGWAAGEPTVGLRDDVVRNAISSDGSRVVWSEFSGHLYMRDVALGQTVELDAVQGGEGINPATPEFQAASEDGSRVYFTDTQRLTADSGAGTGLGEDDLYECRMVVEGGVLKCVLSDLTPVEGGGGGADVQQEVMGVSGDGAYVYFAADGVLAAGASRESCGEQASAAALCNLYEWHEGVTSLVAVVSAGDSPDWSGNDLRRLAHTTARVSVNGEWLAFMSRRGLTGGYDTGDAVTGAPDEEVYVFDGVSGRLMCASCDPSGARPLGTRYAGLLPGLDGVNVWEDAQGIAGSVPGWTSYGTGNARHQPGYLTDSGRLLFNSTDELLSGDVDGVGDVYEFDPAGVAGCSSGLESFSGVTGGCVGLVSSGSSREESGFLDASASAGDVFFLTSAQLGREDRDTAFDVYDRHECTTGEPCFPVPAAAAGPCESSGTCQGASVAVPVAGAPGSETFSGTGNVQPVAAVHVVVHLSRAQLLSKALKVCRAKKRRAPRAACERAARARYGHTKKKPAKKPAKKLVRKGGR